MTRRRRYRFRPHAALFAVALLTPALVAQPGRAGRGKSASATLPESNEALLLSSRVEEAIQAADYHLAIELIERLRGLPDGLVAAPASRTWYPVWRQASRLLAQLPPPGVELYRQLYDAEVSTRFQQAVATADLNALRELFQRYRLSTAWPAIGVELVAHLLDRGASGEAIEVLREASPAGMEGGHDRGAGVAPEHQAQLAVALASAGAVRPARRLLAELQSDADLRAQPEWRDRLARLDRWFAALGPSGFASGAERWQPLSPRIEAGAVWAQALLPRAPGQHVDEGDDLAQAIEVFRRLPLQQPVLAGPTLLVRLHGRLWAVDADTLTLRWSVAERPADGAAGLFAGAVPGDDRNEDLRLSHDARLLMASYLRHAVSVGFGKVYTVEGLTLFDSDVVAFGQRPFRVAGESVRRNELVARDLANGRTVWRTGGEPAAPLFDVAFQNVPVVVGETLVAPAVRGKELNLAVIDPADGRLIREVPLVGPPNKFSDEGGRCPIAADETTLYVCTGNGVIAALARDDLSWKWATVYPSTLAEHLGQLWWQPAQTTAESNIDSPTIADDLLIVAPVDSPDIFALDRFSGCERWRMSRREYPFLIGAVRAGLVVGGHVLACLDLDDPVGRSPRWKSVPLRITGRAAIRDERIYVPTREGIVVLDGQTGKVLADQNEAGAPDRNAAYADRGDSVSPRQASDRPSPLIAPDHVANLLASGEALFSVSSNRVVKYPDLRRARARYADSTEETVGNQRTELVRAWLDALEGSHEQAFARLEERRFADPQLSAARDRLLTYVFLGLAQDAPAGEDRLDWLRRASALADSPQSAARLAVRIGRALEEGGHWPAALRHYGELLYQPEVRYVADTSDADRLLADWLHAAGRIAVLGDQAPADSVEELLSRALRGGNGSDERAVRLQRLRVALEGKSQRDRLDRWLSLQALPPELKIQYLPKDDPTTLPVGLRRRLHLERWDTHVSLGWLDQARADRAVWQAQFANLSVPESEASGLDAFEPLSPREECERVDAIDLALRKLAQSGGQPFTWRLTRQWRIQRAELLFDPRRPLTGLRRWAPVADLGQRRIALINVYDHQHPQRQTADGMIAGRDGVDTGSAGYGQAVEGRRFEWAGGGPRSTWPMVTYQQLAALPVHGGLVCVGLGPERHAGQRQWEYAVSEWGGIPAGFADRSVAGPQGVFFTPRRDRVALVGWFDGRLWWQRDLPEVAIEHLYLADDRLVIVSDDRRVWVTDATFGGRLQRAATGIAAPRRVDLVGDTIVVWGPESVVGVSVRTLQPLWTRPCAPVDDSVTVPQRPWIAYRVFGELEWHLLDVRRGDPVFEPPLGVFDTISAIVAEADQLLVAGRTGLRDGDDEAGLTRLTALDPADGSRHWSRDFLTGAPVNATQLAAHPDIIPILLARADNGFAASDDSGLPAIQLVSKRDGEPSEPFSIKDDYRPVAEATCEMYMLATPTRMIVQVGGNLIAYGDSPPPSTP